MIVVMHFSFSSTEKQDVKNNGPNYSQTRMSCNLAEDSQRVEAKGLTSFAQKTPYEYKNPDDSI